MYRVSLPFTLTISVILVFTTMILPSAALAEVNRVIPTARWAGIAGKIGDGHSGYLCSLDELNKFWKRWEITKPKPKIDFSKELAFLYMGSGGPSLMNLELEESGNLVAVYVETPTVSLYPNYLIFTVPRDGVKSVNGVPVPCSD